MKAVVILVDTLCRRYLPMYGDRGTIAPNLQRLAQASCVFDNHWCGSAPCIPARRDIFTGRLNFLERNWGGAEPFDCLFPELLRDHGVYSHIVTDHCHYLGTGGDGYVQAFNTWEVIRGQEVDEWAGDVKDPEVSGFVGRMVPQYLKNRSRFSEEGDFPTPRALSNAVEWIERNGKEDDYLLWVECYDPHEPFDTPQHYVDMYEDGEKYEGDTFFWPEYARKDIPEKQLKHIRNRYKATLTMMDHWLGKLVDQFDAQNLWEDTMIIVTTDHGFMLGEHDGFFCKNYMPAYNEVFHLPFFVHMPGRKDTSRMSALTQNIDLFPTILEYFNIPLEDALNPIHGKSIIPLLAGETDRIRSSALFGNYGLNVNITDGEYVYFRAAVEKSNQPLNLYYANSATNRHKYGIRTIEDLGVVEVGRYLKWTDYPVFRLPANKVHLNLFQRFDERNDYNADNLLFSLKNDYQQLHPINDPEIEDHYCRLLSRSLEEHDSPDEQWERLGLKDYR